MLASALADDRMLTSRVPANALRPLCRTPVFHRIAARSEAKASGARSCLSEAGRPNWRSSMTQLQR
jgi:hypothetical protein